MLEIIMFENEMIYELYQKYLKQGLSEDDAYMEAQSNIYSVACEENGCFEQGCGDFNK